MTTASKKKTVKKGRPEKGQMLKKDGEDAGKVMNVAQIDGSGPESTVEDKAYLSQEKLTSLIDEAEDIVHNERFDKRQSISFRDLMYKILRKAGVKSRDEMDVAIQETQAWEQSEKETRKGIHVRLREKIGQCIGYLFELPKGWKWEKE